MVDDVVTYHWIQEGQGSKFSYKSSTDHIGTFNCQTCVGVFLSFQDGTCFCAHINPCVDMEAGGMNRRPQGEEGEQFKQMVWKKLKNECGDAVNLRSDREVVVVCPRMYENNYGKDSGKCVKMLGWFVVEGMF